MKNLPMTGSRGFMIDGRLFFLNFRTRNEMNIVHRLIWRIFGKKHENTAHGYHVIAYEFRNITLIWLCEIKKEEGGK